MPAAPRLAPDPRAVALTDAQCHRLRDIVVAAARGCDTDPAAVDFLTVGLPAALAELCARRDAEARLGCAVLPTRPIRRAA